MDITFSQSPVTSYGTAAICSECGAIVSDWLFDKHGLRKSARPNQDLHKLWHEKIIEQIALAATAHLRGNE